jgi:hypothetical protein
LSREHVRELIEEANVPDIYSLRPSPTDYTQADDLASSEERMPGLRGWLERLFGRGTCKAMTIMSPQVPTPASRYVNAMLIQMFERGPKTRVLWRSQSLPTLTLAAETVETPPLEDVLGRLKFMCQLDPGTCRTPTEGAIHITFKGEGPSAEEPYQVLCQFDDKSDACCQIRLERIRK